MNRKVNSSKSLTTCGTQKDDELRIGRMERNHRKFVKAKNRNERSYARRYHDLMPGYPQRYHTAVCMNS